MKVALLVPGGVDRSGTHRVIPVLLWFIERIARAVELHVFALRQEPRPARWPLLGAEVHNIGAPPRALRTLAALIAEHRRGRFDVLHAVWATPGAPAALARSLLGTPLLLHLTGGDLSAMPDRDFGLLATARGRLALRVALAGADRLTVPSGPMIALARRFGVDPEPFVFGVDLERWPARPPRPRDGARPARLLQIGSLNPIKDQPTLLRALRLLIDRGHDVRLDIVGEDTLGGAMHRVAAELRLEDVVTFRGFLTHAELRPLIDAADLHLVSSRHEADPIALLEAAVAGVPTVGTAVGHVHDWSPDAALAVAPGDPDALALGIATLLEDEPRRLATARAAQDRALARDATWSARRALELYRELAPGRS
jgi:glycosyltransferase involved in cell wall biosynthesis